MGGGIGAENALDLLVVVAGRCTCAIPIGVVSETMRPLPVAPIADAPSCVRGIAIIRDEPVPVVDLAALLGSEDARATERFVTARGANARRFALAVTSVVGVRRVRHADLGSLPPLLASAERIEALARADEALLVVLRASHLVPADVWPTLEARAQEERS